MLLTPLPIHVGPGVDAGRIGTVTTVHRFTAGRIDADKLLDERRIPREWISEKVLTHPQAHSDDLPGIRNKRSGLNPHVVSGQRCGAQGERGGNQPAPAPWNG